MTVGTPLWTDRLELPLEPAAVHEARSHTEDTLSEWGVTGGVVEDALLIVSELATNAVRHSKPPQSGGQFVLTLCHLPKALQIYLADGDPQPPVMQEPTDDGTGGRGLILVNELSDKWGLRGPAPDEGPGKAVWAELCLAEPSLIACAHEVAVRWDLGPIETGSAAQALLGGEAAARELAEALGRAGFELPSLHGDFTVADQPLVQLGGAPAEMVRRLACWIRAHAPTPLGGSATS
jgi:anti-sigma regulatory factor (Ser/Thr protein kinase)